MNGIIVLVVVLLIGGIILLSGKSPLRKKTRELFLEDLAKNFEGNLEEVDNEMYSNSFRIRFQFSGQDFIFEDLEKVGFKDKVYGAQIKVATPSKFTLSFAGKRRSTKIRTSIFLASEISSQNVGHNLQLEVPKFLSDFDVYTNDTIIANRIFEFGKTLSVFKQLMNRDSSGYSFMPIEIVNGTIVLEFYSDKTLQPNLSSLYNDVSSFEDYLNKLMTLVRKLHEEL